MITLLIYLVVACILIGVAYYVVNHLLPEPVRNIANVAIVVIAAIVVCWLLLSAVGAVGPMHLAR